jgi:hypothetical protein
MAQVQHEAPNTKQVNNNKALTHSFSLAQRRKKIDAARDNLFSNSA